MLPAFAMAVVLTAAEAPTPVPQGSGTVQLLREACIDTGMNRAAFEELARVRRWRAAPTTRRSGPASWTVAFRKDEALIILTEGPDGDADIGAMCSVSVDRAPATFPAEIADFAASLGMQGEAAPDIPWAGQLLVWSKFGEMTLTYAAGAANDRRAIASLSRQFVTPSE